MNVGNKEKVRTKIDKNIREKAKKIKRNNLIIIIAIILTVIAIYFVYITKHFLDTIFHIKYFHQ